MTRLEEAHVGTIHAFCADLLRERPVEAGVDPLFEVLTEPASARLFDEAFGRWLQEMLSDPPEGVRRALRRSAFGGGLAKAVPSTACARRRGSSRSGATSPSPWTRDPFDRDREIESLVSLLHDVADLSRNPASKNDPLFTGTDPVRRLSDEIRLQQTFDDAGAPDYDGWEAGLVDLSRDRALAYVKQGRGASYRQDVTRERVSSALTELRARLDQFRMVADADLAALLQQELRGALLRYEEMKAKNGALDFLDLLLVARNLVRDNRRVREGFQRRFERIFVDEFQDTDPLQAEILLLLAADDPGETDWRKAQASPGTPLRRRRPQAVHLSVPPRRRVHLSRGLSPRAGLGRYASSPDDELSQRARDPVVRERRVCSGDDRRRPDAAGRVCPARPPPAWPRRRSRRSSRCRFPNRTPGVT